MLRNIRHLYLGVFVALLVALGLAARVNAQDQYPTDAWFVQYWTNVNLAGAPQATGFDEAIDFNWGLGFPAQLNGQNTFSVRWTRSAYFPAGVYRFVATMDDGMRIWVGEIEPIAIATEQITPQNNRNSSPKIAWDFYCGAGIITLLIARRGYRVLGIEENPQAIACAKINAEKNSLKDRLEFMTGQVEELYTEIPTWARMPDLLTVNPSRKGLAPAFKDFLKKHFKQRKNVKLIYVSCDVTTFARDIVDLKEAGFNLRQVEAFDMFCLLYTSPSPRDGLLSRMPSSA